MSDDSQPSLHIRRQQGLSRRRFIQGAGVALAWRTPIPAQSADAEPRTYVYKTVGGVAIHADVYDPIASGTRPVAVWIHGGALINGGRQGVPPLLKQPLIDGGCAVVSIDYRLAPETKLPAIIEDLEDAFRWIREEGPALFGADPERVAALGGSAGGYLTLTAGFRVKPRVNALVAFWGYGDLIGEWYSSPSPHERHRRVVMTRQEALAQVNGPPISNADDREGNGGAFYQHCRQHGVWPQQVSGWDPKGQAEKFRPFMPVENVTADYPPTLLIHGTADTDVPYEQSVMMADEFRRHGVEHELLTVEGAEHGLAGAPPEVRERAYASAVRFVLERLA